MIVMWGVTYFLTAAFILFNQVEYADTDNYENEKQWLARKQGTFSKPLHNGGTDDEFTASTDNQDNDNVDHSTLGYTTHSTIAEYGLHDNGSIVKQIDEDKL